MRRLRAAVTAASAVTVIVSSVAFAGEPEIQLLVQAPKAAESVEAAEKPVGGSLRQRS